MTVEVSDRGTLKLLHSLNEKKLIRIVDEAQLNSPSLPGSPLSLNAFKNWVSNAEAGKAISLKKAEQKWGVQKRKLENLPGKHLSKCPSKYR